MASSYEESETEHEGAVPEPVAPETEVPEDEADAEEPKTTFWEDVRDLYLSFDRRTLGIARIFIGLFLIFDLLRRTDDWWKMFADDGVLPTHYNLWRPQAGGWTLLNAFSTRGELWALWGFIFVVYFLYLIGWKTKIWQVLAAIIVASLNGRILLIENGGYVVHNLLLLWTAFLPLGDRFSVDALQSSWRTQREKSAADLNDRTTDVAHWRLKPFVTILGLVLLLQLSSIYLFNVLHKTGPAWHNGTAVHYVLYVDRMVTPFIGAVRDHTPFWIVWCLTNAVMGMEAGMTVALFSPLASAWARRCAILFINLLHIGFGSTFVLGPFAWALCCFSVLLFGREDWDLGEKTLRRVHRRRTVLYDPASRAAFFWCRLLKRLDRFELLTFEADPKARRLEVMTPSGERRSGRLATADLLSALPAGPLIGVPMRLPIIGHLLAILAAPIAGFVRLCVGTRKRKIDEKTRTEYRPELKDDGDNPTVDAYYMRDWLHEHYGGSLRMLWINGGIAAFGFFVFVWLSELLRTKLEWNTKLAMFGEGVERPGVWSYDDAIFYGGLLIFAVGVYRFIKPFAIMNFTTPSTAKRKWVRVLAIAREALVVLFWIGAINQAVVELWKFRSLRLPQPEFTRVFSHKLRYLQGWFMFSPNPVMDDGIIVVDAITVDGRRVDPFTVDTYHYHLEAPHYDLLHSKSEAYNQIWSDYFNRMHLPANTAFRKPMKEYMFRLPERTGNPNDAIVKGTVWWVHDMNPRWGRHDSYAYDLKELFTFSNPDPEVQARYRELTGGIDPPELPLPAEPMTKKGQPSPITDTE